MGTKINIKVFVAIIIVAVFSLLAYFGALTTLENRLYDVLLHIKKHIPEDQRILLMDIDSYNFV